MTINSNTLFLRTVLLHDLGFVQSNSMIDSLFFPDKNVTYFKRKHSLTTKIVFFKYFNVYYILYNPGRNVALLQPECHVAQHSPGAHQQTWSCLFRYSILRPGASYLGKLYSDLELPI